MKCQVLGQRIIDKNGIETDMNLGLLGKMSLKVDLPLPILLCALVMVTWGSGQTQSQSLSKSVGGIHRRMGGYKFSQENNKCSAPGRSLTLQGHHLHPNRNLGDLGSWSSKRILCYHFI